MEDVEDLTPERRRDRIKALAKRYATVPLSEDQQKLNRFIQIPKTMIHVKVHLNCHFFFRKKNKRVFN